jgi:WD40 repeat protein
VSTLTGSEHVYAVTFSPDGKQILSGGRDRSTFGELLQGVFGETENNKGVTVRLWDSADGRLIQSFADNADDVRSVAFSPDGKWMAAASLDKRVSVWRR